MSPPCPPIKIEQNQIVCRKLKKGIQGTWVLSALVGLLVLYGIAHIVAILHRKRGELQQLMKGSF